MSNLGLVPLKNFGIVEEGKIYRCAQPLYGYEYKWIVNMLNIKTVCNLRIENRDEIFCKKWEIGYIHLPVPDKHDPTLLQCNIFMDAIKDGGDFPLLIHCQHGHGRTSTFCILARIAMGWTLKDALKEEDRKFHYFFKHSSQKDFLIKNFS